MPRSTDGRVTIPSWSPSPSTRRSIPFRWTTDATHPPRAAGQDKARRGDHSRGCEAAPEPRECRPYHLADPWDFHGGAGGARNGLDHDSVANCDGIATIPVSDLGVQIGFLLDSQEDALTGAIHAAFDLDDGS